MNDTFFAYNNGTLQAEDVPLAAIAAAVGTPFYVYSSLCLRQRALDWAQSFNALGGQVCYAVKANNNPALLKIIAAQGIGADVVSGGELRMALKCGIPGRRCVFSGVGKSASELAFALKNDILQINVESAAELHLLNDIAQQLKITARIALRVNPDIDAGTHAKITTGTAADKFGINWQDVPTLLMEAANMPGIMVQGLAMHIGSQLTSLKPFEAAYKRLADMADEMTAYGHTLRTLDIGGGLGVRYTDESPPSLGDYSALVKRTLGHLSCRLLVEPGRHMVASAGALVSKVLYTKTSGSKHFAIMDTGMNDLLRPAMYDACHTVLPVQQRSGAETVYDVVGPICESSDTFRRNLPLPALQPGDLLAVTDAGAYGSVMGSTYNIRLPAAEVLVEGNRFAVIRARPSYDDLERTYKTPQWRNS